MREGGGKMESERDGGIKRDTQRKKEKEKQRERPRRERCRVEFWWMTVLCSYQSTRGTFPAESPCFKETDRDALIIIPSNVSRHSRALLLSDRENVEILTLI